MLPSLQRASRTLTSRHVRIWHPLAARSSHPAARLAPSEAQAVYMQPDGAATLQLSVKSSGVAVPDYLQEVYWWAYVHPNAVKFFERQWLVDAILWGNFRYLRDCAMNALCAGSSIKGKLTGRTLQIACVYGDLTPKLVDRLAPSASLDIVDVLAVQLENLRKKLPRQLVDKSVTLLQRDATDLHGLADGSYDQVLLFFLLHEMPLETREATLREAMRVVRPGGRIHIVDYHQPSAFSPHRYIMRPVLATLEPFALDLWRGEISDWLPKTDRPRTLTKSTHFAGLYQSIVVQL